MSGNNDPLANSPRVMEPSPPSLLNRFAASASYSNFVFLPDYTEHPKPRRRMPTQTLPPQATSITEPGSEDADVTFMQDFIAGGLAGSCSVIIGHPLDTAKVRVQNSLSANPTFLSTIRDFGGVSSLFRGMSAPLGTAALVNAIIFSSYGMASTAYDKYYADSISPDDNFAGTTNHDPWEKSMRCGMFAGFVQCFLIAPMEHVKIRLQCQETAPSAASKSMTKPFYNGPIHATQQIVSQYGIGGLYKGWWATFWREVPAFGAYFAIYDLVKDRTNTFLAKQAGMDHEAPPSMAHTHTWLASALAGGVAGSCSWGLIMPMDVIKSHIQAAPLDASMTIRGVATNILQTHGWRHLFRGLGITLIRAFPVNGTIFPVYEFTLMHIKERKWGY
ncbi:hypothetical protein MPSEU_000499600 [Mayamaea pseudoterrestris]|nr:hypothetical protein MPSEU_000499600 [Mayamaea pseudoterrestris]